MSSFFYTFDVMIDLLKEYANKRVELFKLQATEKSSIGSGFVVFFVLAFAALSFFVLMLNIAVGLLIGHSLGNYGLGVLIVSGFYLLILILILVFRKPIMKNIANKVIEFLNH